MEEKAQIILDGKTYDFPVVIGTENEKAIDFHVDNVERVKEGKYKIKKNYDRLEVYVTMDRV